MMFKDIVGHEALASRMRQGVQSGRIPHAQLFSGASGRGGLALALAYVQYINCPNRSESDSCGTCPQCLQMSQLAHPDLHMVMPVNRQGKKSGEAMLSRNFMALWRSEMDHARGYLTPERWYEALELGKTLKGVISADEADDIIRSLALKSFNGGYKSMIIWLPEMMNEQAANKILKILEEPWDKTLFILVTEQEERLLATIRSRTQQLEIPHIDVASLERYAAEHGVSDAAKRHSVARLASGDLVELQRAMGGDNSAQRRSEMFSKFTQLMRLSYGDKHMELMEWAEQMGQLTRADQLEMLRYSLTMLREAYMRHAGVSEVCYAWGEEADFCTKFAPYIGNNNIEQLIAEIELARQQITQNANPTILFTHFALMVSKMIVKL